MWDGRSSIQLRLISRLKAYVTLRINHELDTRLSSKELKIYFDTLLCWFLGALSRSLVRIKAANRLFPLQIEGAPSCSAELNSMQLEPGPHTSRWTTIFARSFL